MYGKLPGNMKEAFEAGLKPVEIKPVKKARKERAFYGKEIKKGKVALGQAKRKLEKKEGK